MPYCSVLNTRLYYEEEGQGDPMILVHGAAQDTLCWRFAVPYLSKHFRTIAIDLPGHGKSDRAPQGIIQRIEDYARFINGFIDERGLGQVLLVGHSMSGGNVLQASLNRPDQVKAAIPVDGAGMTLKAAVSYSDELLELITVNPYDYWETNFQALCSHRTPDERKQLIALEAKRIPAEIILGDLHAYTSFDIRDKVKQISVPVILITGGDDWSCTPDNVRHTARMLECPKALEVLPGVGHFPHMEAPKLFSETLVRLLSDL
jgi:pimeloyl-ACP methyl ester carboxylesterase